MRAKPDGKIDLWPRRLDLNSDSEKKKKKPGEKQEKSGKQQLTDGMELPNQDKTLIHTVRIYSQDIGKRKVCNACNKSGKQHLTDGIELPNQDTIKTLAENETYKYLGILEVDTIKQVEMKEKIRKEYLRRTRKLLETNLNSRILIKGINTWTVPLVRYSGPFLKWTRD